MFYHISEPYEPAHISLWKTLLSEKISQYCGEKYLYPFSEEWIQCVAS